MPTLLPGEARAEALRRVGDNQHPVRLGDFVDGIVVRRLAVEIDRDHAAWLEPALLRFADRGFEALDIEVESISAAHPRTPAWRRHSTATSTVATKVKAGTNTASPLPTPSAIRASSRASVPLAQLMQCLAPQNAASCRSSSPTSGPSTNWPWFSTAEIARLDAVAEMVTLCREVDKGRERLAYGLCSCDLHQGSFAHSSSRSGQCGIEAWPRSKPRILVEFREFPQSSCRPRRRLP